MKEGILIPPTACHKASSTQQPQKKAKIAVNFKSIIQISLSPIFPNIRHKI